MLQNIWKIEGGPFRDIKKKSSRKKTENRKIRILSQSHSAEKLEKGDPLGFLKLQFAVKYQKTWRGDPLETNKITKKSRTVPKKTQRGDPIVSSDFVFYDKNGVTERGTRCTILNALTVCRSSSLVL